jgi:hypothetical protein
MTRLRKHRIYFAVPVSRDEAEGDLEGLGQFGWSTQILSPGSGFDAPPRFGPRVANRLRLPGWLTWLVRRFAEELD